MDSPIFIDYENIPLVTHYDENYDNDYNDYNTPNTSRVDETTFTMPGPTDIQATSTLRLWQKLKWDKPTTLYRHLNVAGDLDLISFDLFNYVKNNEKDTTILEFYNS